MIVVDANVAVSWLLQDSKANSSYGAVVADLSLDGAATLIAPSVLVGEVSYVLLFRGRKLRWGAARIGELAETYDSFDIRLVEVPGTIAAMVRFAIRHNVTGFDAYYLALAMSAGAKLATLDGGLRTAEQNAGVVLAWGAEPTGFEPAPNRGAVPGAKLPCKLKSCEPVLLHRADRLRQGLEERTRHRAAVRCAHGRQR